MRRRQPKPVRPIRYTYLRRQGARAAASVTTPEADQPGTGTRTTSASRAAAELEDLLDEAANAAAYYDILGGRWSQLYLMLGLPAAILAAIAGATALASTTTRVLAGFIALASAGLSAAVAFLNSKANEERYASLGAAWAALDSAVREAVSKVSRLADMLAETLTAVAAAPQDGYKVADMQDEVDADMKRLYDQRNQLLRGVIPSPDDQSRQPVRVHGS
jgi:hypothetical protein